MKSQIENWTNQQVYETILKTDWVDASRASVTFKYINVKSPSLQRNEPRHNKNHWIIISFPVLFSRHWVPFFPYWMHYLKMPLFLTCSYQIMYRDSIWASFVAFGPIKHGILSITLQSFLPWTKINNIVSSLLLFFLWWYFSKLPFTFQLSGRHTSDKNSIWLHFLTAQWNLFVISNYHLVRSDILYVDRYDTVELSLQPNICTIIFIHYNI